MKQNLTFYDFPQKTPYFKQLCIFELTRLHFKKLHIYLYISEFVSICWKECSITDVRAKYIQLNYCEIN